MAHNTLGAIWTLSRSLVAGVLANVRAYLDAGGDAVQGSVVHGLNAGLNQALPIYGTGNVLYTRVHSMNALTNGTQLTGQAGVNIVSSVPATPTWLAQTAGYYCNVFWIYIKNTGANPLVTLEVDTYDNSAVYSARVASQAFALGAGVSTVFMDLMSAQVIANLTPVTYGACFPGYFKLGLTVGAGLPTTVDYRVFGGRIGG